MKQHYLKKCEDGVSPVIGVMLMLVVTLIIAALVTAFSSGLIDTESTTPVVYLDAEIVSNQGEYVLNIKHLGGDTLDTADLKILSEYSYEKVNSADNTKIDSTHVSSQITSATPKTTIIKKVGSTPAVTARVPYLSDISVGNPAAPSVQFGAFDLTAGDIMTTGTTLGTAKVISGGTSLPAGFGVGSKVDIKIIYTPSDTVIFSEEVHVI